MKKNILIFALLVLSLNTIAQVASPNAKSESTHNKVMPFIAGELITENGVQTINVEIPIEFQYFVSLTPHGNSTSLYLAEKNVDNCVVKTLNGSDIVFDYVIFVRRKTITVD